MIFSIYPEIDPFSPSHKKNRNTSPFRLAWCLLSLEPSTALPTFLSPSSSPRSHPFLHPLLFFSSHTHSLCCCRAVSSKVFFLSALSLSGDLSLDVTHQTAHPFLLLALLRFAGGLDLSYLSHTHSLSLSLLSISKGFALSSPPLPAFSSLFCFLRKGAQRDQWQSQHTHTHTHACKRNTAQHLQ